MGLPSDQSSTQISQVKLVTLVKLVKLVTLVTLVTQSSQTKNPRYLPADLESKQNYSIMLSLIITLSYKETLWNYFPFA
ncbi:hypothetical protein DSECCO2_394220 [anaerobic digester metagenome]